jgi:hypothetical protein
MKLKGRSRADAARRASELGLLIQRGDWYRLLSETCVNVG